MLMTFTSLPAVPQEFRRGKEPTAQGDEHRKEPGRSPGAKRKSLLPRAFACSCFFASWHLVEETKSFLFCGKGKHSIF